MLQVDHAHHAPARHQRHGQECFISVLRQFMEELEAGILGSVFRDCDRFAMFRHPAGDALSHVQFQPVHNLRVRILGGAEQQFVILQHINQAGIALHQGRCKIHNPREHFVQRVGGSHLSAKRMKKIYGRIVDSR